MKKVTRYQVWAKALRKYKNIQKRISALEHTPLKIKLEHKLSALKRRIRVLNTKWKLGITASILFAWMSSPAMAQMDTLNVQTDLDGQNGFKIVGADFKDGAGLGDFNGDGFDDFVLESNGHSYVIFGKSDISSGLTEYDVSDLDGSNGFVLTGFLQPNFAGDFNGDGYNDIIAGNDSQVQLIFGNPNVIDTLDKADLNGTNGFNLVTLIPGSSPGERIVGVGDINKDGYGDITYIPSYVSIRNTLVYFGYAGPFAANEIMPSLNGSNGFKIDKARHNSVAVFAGDLNNDGYDDMFTGDQDSYFRSVSGKSEVYPSLMGISQLEHEDDFLVSDVWVGVNSASGGALDVNGDGFDDLGLGVYGKNHSFVVFGGEDRGNDSIVDPFQITASDGIYFDDLPLDEYSSVETVLVPDLNSDGFDDIVLTTVNQYYGSEFKSFVVFGSETIGGTIDVATLTPEEGIEIQGSNGGVTRSLGDINNDNVGDFIIVKNNATYLFTLNKKLITSLHSNLIKEADLDLFPNPVSQGATINFGSELEHIVIIDMMGREMGRFENKSSITVDYVSGLYLVVTNKGQTKFEIVND